jgi:hypothetical protein
VAETRGTAWIAPRVAAWIRRQRDQFGAAAAPLDEERARVLAPFVPGRILAKTRFVTARRRWVESPPFPRGLGRLATRALFELRLAEAITFDDVVVLRSNLLRAPQPAALGLCFHELVHAVQYDLLGVDEFARRYTGGWIAAGFRYRSIPLEKTAYDLAARFERDPAQAFDVENAVVEDLRTTAPE